MTWLTAHFPFLPDDVDDQTVQYHTRAYIRQLIGGLLISDQSGHLVHLMFLPLLRDWDTVGIYSWGSATLTWLYRSLCHASQIYVHDIAGNLLLLQIWIWECIPRTAPYILHPTPQGDAPLAVRWAVDLDTIQRRGRRNPGTKRIDSFPVSQLSIHSWDPGGPGGPTTAPLFSRIHTSLISVWAAISRAQV